MLGAFGLTERHNVLMLRPTPVLMRTLLISIIFHNIIVFANDQCGTRRNFISHKENVNAEFWKNGVERSKELLEQILEKIANHEKSNDRKYDLKLIQEYKSQLKNFKSVEVCGEDDSMIHMHVSSSDFLCTTIANFDSVLNTQRKAIDFTCEEAEQLYGIGYHRLYDYCKDEPLLKDLTIAWDICLKAHYPWVPLNQPICILRSTEREYVACYCHVDDGVPGNRSYCITKLECLVDETGTYFIADVKKKVSLDCSTQLAYFIEANYKDDVWYKHAQHIDKLRPRAPYHMESPCYKQEFTALFDIGQLDVEHMDSEIEILVPEGLTSENLQTGKAFSEDRSRQKLFPSSASPLQFSDDLLLRMTPELETILIESDIGQPLDQTIFAKILHGGGEFFHEVLGGRSGVPAGFQPAAAQVRPPGVDQLMLEGQLGPLYKGKLLERITTNAGIVFSAGLIHIYISCMYSDSAVDKSWPLSCARLSSQLTIISGKTLELCYCLVNWWFTSAIWENISVVLWLYVMILPGVFYLYAYYDLVNALCRNSVIEVILSSVLYYLIMVFSGQWMLINVIFVLHFLYIIGVFISMALVVTNEITAAKERKTEQTFIENRRKKRTKPAEPRPKLSVGATSTTNTANNNTKLSTGRIVPEQKNVTDHNPGRTGDKTSANDNNKETHTDHNAEQSETKTTGEQPDLKVERTVVQINCQFHQPYSDAVTAMSPYIVISCSARCVLKYHQHCCRILLDSIGLHSEREFLNSACQTPNCWGSIVEMVWFNIYGEVTNKKLTYRGVNTNGTKPKTTVSHAGVGAVGGGGGGGAVGKRQSGKKRALEKTRSLSANSSSSMSSSSCPEGSDRVSEDCLSGGGSPCHTGESDRARAGQEGRGEVRLNTGISGKSGKNSGKGCPLSQINYSVSAFSNSSSSSSGGGGCSSSRIGAAASGSAINSNIISGSTGSRANKKDGGGLPPGLIYKSGARRQKPDMLNLPEFTLKELTSGPGTSDTWRSPPDTPPPTANRSSGFNPVVGQQLQLQKTIMDSSLPLTSPPPPLHNLFHLPPPPLPQFSPLPLYHDHSNSLLGLQTTTASSLLDLQTITANSLLGLQTTTANSLLGLQTTTDSRLLSQQTTNANSLLGLQTTTAFPPTSTTTNKESKILAIIRQNSKSQLSPPGQSESGNNLSWDLSSLTSTSSGTNTAQHEATLSYISGDQSAEVDDQEFWEFETADSSMLQELEAVAPPAAAEKSPSFMLAGRGLPSITDKRVYNSGDFPEITPLAAIISKQLPSHHPLQIDFSIRSIMAENPTKNITLLQFKSLVEKNLEKLVAGEEWTGVFMSDGSGDELLCEDDDIDECLICTELLEDKLLKLSPCHHLFHEVCILSWLAKDKTCPKCRAVVSPTN